VTGKTLYTLKNKGSLLASMVHSCNLSFAQKVVYSGKKVLQLIKKFFTPRKKKTVLHCRYFGESRMVLEWDHCEKKPFWRIYFYEYSTEF